MYAFSILAIPLGFLLLVIAAYPAEERKEARRAFTRGMLAFIPLLIVERIIGTLVPAAYGTPLLSIREWAQRILPCALLPATVYLVFYRAGEELPTGCVDRRLTAFYAGALTPMGLADAIRIWEKPEPYTILVFPWILAAIALAAPRALLAARSTRGFRLVLVLVSTIAMSAAASLGPWLFLARLWPLSWLLAGLIFIGAWLLSLGPLLRPPLPRAID